MQRRNVVLTGFMGTGKSTVGKRLAKRLGYDFVDTDALIEVETGRSVADIFQQEGERSFRRWESRIARRLSGAEGMVIATGGRLMLDADNAAALANSSDVICLTAEPEEIIARLADDGGRRPLISGKDPAGRIEHLLAHRARAYGRFPQVNTSGKSIDEVVEEILGCISVN